MARALKNHPGHSLANAAADAFDAYEAKYGVFVLNSARRTPAQQQTLINRWDQGGMYNRPPYLYQPYRPAEGSNHVKNDGVAVDIGDWRRFQEHMAEFGFAKPVPSDVVHFEFRGGSSSSKVKPYSKTTLDRQNFLISRGWKLKADGLEGPQTRQAYAEYQGQLNTMGYDAGVVDGIWGNKTQAAHHKFWQSLQAKPTAVPKLTYKLIQQGLRNHGYNIVVDNIWGPRSSDALYRFQRSKGLVPDRMVGPKTRAALGI